MVVYLELLVYESVGEWAMEDDLEDLKTLEGTIISIVEGRANRIAKGLMQKITMEETTMDLQKMGAILKKLREGKKLRHKDYSPQMSSGYVSHLENGKCAPSLEKLRGWAKITGYSLRDIIGVFEAKGVFDEEGK